jgi:hypothetical protein
MRSPPFLPASGKYQPKNVILENYENRKEKRGKMGTKKQARIKTKGNWKLKG